MKTAIFAVALSALAIGSAYADDYTAGMTEFSATPSYGDGTVYSSTSGAGEFSTESTYYSQGIGDGVSLGVGATTTYGSPGYGDGGPAVSTDTGSWSDTSYGGAVIWEFD